MEDLPKDPRSPGCRYCIDRIGHGGIMNILRLSRLSLALAIAVITFGYVNSASAHKTGEQHNHGGGGDANSLTYTVDLRGTSVSFDHRGAFEFEPADATSQRPATLDKGSLTGAGLDVVLKRAFGDVMCSGPMADEMGACSVWNDLFNLCGLLGPWGEVGPDESPPPSTNLDQFTVKSGDWSVRKGGGRFWIGFEFTIPAIVSPETDRDLSASLQLTGVCVDAEADPSCPDHPLIPTEPGTTSNILTHAEVHLRGKGGVTHRAVCHADDDPLGMNESTLVITADLP